MAIIYDPGGTKINTTISANTKTALCDNMKTEIVNAGFSVVSGSSGDWKLECAPTASGGYAARCRLFTGTNGVKIQLLNTVESAVSNAETVLFPQTGKDYRIWANQHQWLCWEENSVTAGAWAMWCQPFVPPHLLGTTGETAFCCSNGGNDGSSIGAGGLTGFRAAIDCNNAARLYNGVLNGGLGGDPDRPIIPRLGSNNGEWSNGDKMLYDAVVAYNNNGSKTGQFQGYIWEAFLTGGDFPVDKITTDDVPGFTGIKGRAVTDGNASHTTLWILDNP